MKSIILSLALIVASCKTVPIDPSIAAVSADYTVAMTASEAAPGRGLDILRVKAGSPIASTWTLILPVGSVVKGGEADAQFRDSSKQYGILPGASTVEIPMKDLIGHDNWEATDAGTAVVFVALNIDTGTGLTPVKARGLLFIVVTDPSYDPMPIDSGYAASVTKCKIQYSTAGRSAIKCK